MACSKNSQTCPPCFSESDSDPGNTNFPLALPPPTALPPGGHVQFQIFAFVFAATLVSGTVSHEDLVEADQRAARIFHALDTVYLKDPEWHAEPFSVMFLREGYMSMVFLLLLACCSSVCAEGIVRFSKVIGIPTK